MTVWTNAHVGQFAEPGWRYLGGEGTGMLPGGGSYTAMMPAASAATAAAVGDGGRRRLGEATGDSDFSCESAQSISQLPSSLG